MSRNIYTVVDDFLSRGRRIVLARIVHRAGPAPRAVGSKCILADDGSTWGTIGGGLLEHQVLERAKGVLREEKAAINRFELTGKDVSKSDMLCGGIVDVYLEPLSPENRETLDLFREVGSMIGSGEKGVLLTLISDGISALDRKGRLLVKEDGSVQGEIEGLPEGVEIPGKVSKPSLVDFPHTQSRVFVEPIVVDPMVFLFGAGHVSTFIAPLAKMLGFRLVVIDDRSEFANKDRFPDADKILALPFQEAFEQIRITDKSYVVIVTRGHTFDKIVLQSAILREPAYIGMIGSIRKRDTIYSALIEEGISQAAIEKVHSPIGIDIHAETPEEIAVSIAAELVKVRALRDQT